MPTTALRRTPLHAEHLALGAKMAPFAGWDMPIQYTGIIEEHRAVREGVGLFDVSHMLRVDLRGPGATDLLAAISTYDPHRVPVGRGHYALLCEPDGGIRDDVFLYRTGTDEWTFVGNASNAEADLDQLRRHAGPGSEVVSRQAETAMLALQGPRAASILAGLWPGATSLRARGCERTAIGGRGALVARTGYTGEDGFEIIVTHGDAPEVWRQLLREGAAPCGLGARDTLRLEAALVLYGNDIDRSTNPFEAGLGWVVDLDDRDFVGSDALRAIRDRPPERTLVCLRAVGRGVPRHGHAVLRGDEVIGDVTSGTFSPTLGTGIAMAYVAADAAAPGTALVVDLRGRPLPATVVPRPFYRRPGRD